MMQHSFFKEKKILVVDQSTKNNNDRTWCFWEKKQGIFEDIVHHKWKQLNFYSHNFSSRLNILSYEYKMIRGIDFYNHIIEQAKQHANIHFHQGKVEALTNENDHSVALVDGKNFSADFIFNSILFNSQLEKKGIYYLLQHFKGWWIETASNVFEERVATFMDFRVNQEHQTVFVYVLPLAPDKALIEYTLISKNMLPPNEYEEGLKKYIADFLRVKNYVIKEEEFGVIPMTNYLFPKGEGRIINIGTAGGQTKAGSGFTFNFIQKHCDKIIASLVSHQHLHFSFSAQKRFRLYDNILLNILSNRKMPAEKIFAHLFKKNPPQLVLKFLDNETTLKEDLKIMRSVPLKIFLPAAIHEVFKMHP
jgi:lycopene beta-cyclase